MVGAATTPHPLCITVEFLIIMIVLRLCRASRHKVTKSVAWGHLRTAMRCEPDCSNQDLQRVVVLFVLMKSLGPPFTLGVAFVVLSGSGFFGAIFFGLIRRTKPRRAVVTCDHS